MSEFRILDYNYIFDETVELTASSEDASYPVSNLRHFHRSKVWRTTSASSSFLDIDLKTIEEIDTVIIVTDPRAFPLVNGNEAAVRLYGNAVPSMTSPAFTAFMDSEMNENYGIISYFIPSPESYRYWRILVNAATSNQLGYHEFSKIFLGKSTQLSQMPSIGYKLGESDASNREFTPYGNMFADAYPSRRKISLGHNAMLEADKNLLQDIYRRVGNVKPVCIALDPLEDFFVEKEEKIMYCNIEGDFVPEQVFGTYYSVELGFQEAL